MVSQLHIDVDEIRTTRTMEHANSGPGKPLAPVPKSGSIKGMSAPYVTRSDLYSLCLAQNYT